jgi:hypothetical protein
MTKAGTTAIYMLKKSADGFIVSFRLGTDDGVRPGMNLAVLNEDGFRVGTVEVLTSTETESEALVSGESGVKLGCLIRRPAAGNAVKPSAH